MKKSGQNKIIIVAGALVIVACFFAVYLRLFTNRELWYESFAAILGVIITAVITLLLLKGQSNNDVEKEVMGEKAYQMVQSFLPVNVEMRLEEVYKWLLDN